MSTVRTAQQAVSFALAAIVTFSVMLGLNGLASPDSAAVTELVAAASAPKA
ncbi:hypothetical protein [Ideonella sp. A 288]|uniref:hypothetical protein n=1 Tax=Ideonella sp. A 288 TaxID=1962181 RepID=UPI001302EF58|nr:hypothetical protein [Ideonella sp. A 288]